MSDMGHNICIFLQFLALQKVFTKVCILTIESLEDGEQEYKDRGCGHGEGEVGPWELKIQNKVSHICKNNYCTTGGVSLLSNYQHFAFFIIQDERIRVGQ